MVTGTRGTPVDILLFLKSGVGLGQYVVNWLGIKMPYLLTGFSPSVNMKVHL
jgi:hypothetical protein